MRSRYSAYAKRLPGYLLRTWDPRTRPDTLELERSPAWTRLEVLAVIDGGPDDGTGTVEFRAHHQRDGRDAVLHERSRFRRVDGAWCYVDGEEPEQRRGVAGSPRP
jgi:SEC-C motif-containing protein